MPFFNWLDVLDRPKAMVKNSGLSQIKKKNMNKATVYRVTDIKCGKYF